MFMFGKKARMPQRNEALPGRAEAMAVPARHYVSGNPLKPPFPEGMELAQFGLGCFWGAERKFWQCAGVIYTYSSAQHEAALKSRTAYQAQLLKAGYSQITTEIADAGPFYYAEDYHQQYLAKNPGGYCGVGGTGVACPVGVQSAG